MIKKPTFRFEKQFWLEGFQSVVGVDEVGRGCLAGPVVAGATLFDQKHRRIGKVHDSKLVSEKQRGLLAPQLQLKAKSFGIGLATVEEINTLGISAAIFLAMERAIAKLPFAEVILVDGKFPPKFPTLQPKKLLTVIKGDRLSYSIAAASIIAKVYRDHLMKDLSKQFPHYCWDQNVGYATASHREAISQHGLCEHHRTLFCRKFT